MKTKHGYRVRRFGIISKILYFFVDSPLTPLLIVGSLLLGALAVYLLPREEEPQIVVPVIDVFVQMPGSNAQEVEQRVTRPLEKLAWEIPGVEYVYSTSSPGQSLTIVRFLVGWGEEEAIVQLYQKLYANLDRIPDGASRPLLKPRRIDDVPVLALTLHGGDWDFYALRKIAAAVDDAVKQVPDVSETSLIGGQRRQVRVELDATLLSAYQIDPTNVLRILRAANRQNRAGSFPLGDTETLIETGGFLRDRRDVEMVVVGVHMGQQVYLRDVATVIDGPEEPETYVLFGRGASAEEADAGIADRRARGYPNRRQAQGHQCRERRCGGHAQGRSAARQRHSRWRRGDRDPRLWSHRDGEVRRAAVPHGPRRRRRHAARGDRAGLARVRRRRDCHSDHPRADAGDLLSARLHA